jgi:hypothetical protein
MRSLISILFILQLFSQGLLGQRFLSVKAGATEIGEGLIIGIDRPAAGTIIGKPIGADNILIVNVETPNAELFPGELGNAALLYEGDRLKILYPEDYRVYGSYEAQSRVIHIRAYRLRRHLTDIRQLLTLAQYDSALMLIRSMLAFAGEEGELWYLAGMARRGLGEEDKAQINFRKAGQFGFTAPVSSDGSEANTQAESESLPDDSTAEILLIFVVLAIVSGVALLFLFWRRKTAWPRERPVDQPPQRKTSNKNIPVQDFDDSDATVFLDRRIVDKDAEVAIEHAPEYPVKRATNENIRQGNTAGMQTIPLTVEEQLLRLPAASCAMVLRLIDNGHSFVAIAQETGLNEQQIHQIDAHLGPLCRGESA